MESRKDSVAAIPAEKINSLKLAYKYFFNDAEYRQDYKGTKVIYPFYETLPTVEKFQADKADICIATFPKAGTTFISAIVRMILNDADPKSLTEGLPLDKKIPFLEFKTPAMEDGKRPVDFLLHSPPPRVFFTHLGFDALPKSIPENARIIYVARNPRDCIVSQFKFLSASPVMGFTGTLDDMANAFVDNTCVYAPFYDHVAGYWKYHWNQPNVFFITFEQMKKNLNTVIRDLTIFLGKELTQEQIDNVAHHCSFESMEKNDKVNHSELVNVGYGDPAVSKFMRAGNVGNWKEHFSPETEKTINAWIAKEEDRLKESLAGFKFEFE